MVIYYSCSILLISIILMTILSRSPLSLSTRASLVYILYITNGSFQFRNLLPPVNGPYIVFHRLLLSSKFNISFGTAFYKFQSSFRCDEIYIWCLQARMSINYQKLFLEHRDFHIFLTFFNLKIVLFEYYSMNSSTNGSSLLLLVVL